MTAGAYPNRPELARPDQAIDRRPGNTEQGRRLATKFDALVEPMLGGPRARELREMIAGLDSAAEVASLTRLAAG